LNSAHTNAHSKHPSTVPLPAPMVAALLALKEEGLVVMTSERKSASQAAVKVASMVQEMLATNPPAMTKMMVVERVPALAAKILATVAASVLVTVRT